MFDFRAYRTISRRTAGALGALAVLALQAAPAAAPRVASAAPATPPCSAVVLHGVLPAWARSGFSEAKPRMAHELGKNSQIIAILWADPLLSPPPIDHNNKILWVSHAALLPRSPLVITAQRMSGTQLLGAPVTRTLGGGPGPSIVNLPAAGCWRLNLSWSGHQDTLDLRYAPRG